MDKLDVMLKDAFVKYADVEMERLSDVEENHAFSEKFHQQMQEIFPFLEKVVQ